MRVLVLLALATTADSDGATGARVRKAAPTPQFVNVTALNRSATKAAVTALLATKLRHYELQTDAIAGRRHLGALPSELLSTMPGAVLRTASRPPTAKTRGHGTQPSTAPRRTPLAIDTTHFLMHGLVTTRALSGALRKVSTRAVALTGDLGQDGDPIASDGDGNVNGTAPGDGNSNGTVTANDRAGAVHDTTRSIKQLRERLRAPASAAVVAGRVVAEREAAAAALGVASAAGKAARARDAVARKARQDRATADREHKLDVARRNDTHAKEVRRDRALADARDTANRKTEALRRQTELQLQDQAGAAAIEQARANVGSALRNAQEKVRAEIERERKNEDVAMRALREKGEAARERTKAAVLAAARALGDGFNALVGDSSAVLSLVDPTAASPLRRLLVSLVALAAGVYGAKEAAALAGRVVERRLGRPSLVRETTRVTGVWPSLLVLGRALTWALVSVAVTPCTALCRRAAGRGGTNRTGHLAGSRAEKAKGKATTPADDAAGVDADAESDDGFGGIIMDESLRRRVVLLARATRNARRHGAPFRHLLLYGPPGTGKTTVARRLAERSGMDYATMSGGDVGPLGADAVTELHALFNWARTSRRGLLLFIDEAEAFLASRGAGTGGKAATAGSPTKSHPGSPTKSPSAGGNSDQEGAASGGAPAMSEHQRNALNALLYQTGEQSHSFMLVIATNRPEDLDVAVLDRMDEALEFPLPTAREREQLLRLYFNRCIGERSNRVVERGREPTPSTVAGGGAGVVAWLRRKAALLTGGSSSGARICVELEPGASSSSKNARTASDLLDFAALAIRVGGFSGREIQKLFVSMQAAAYGAPSRVVGGVEEAVLTAELAEQVVSWKHTEHAQKRELQLRESAMLRQRLRLQRRVQAEMRRLAAVEPTYGGAPGVDEVTVGESADRRGEGGGDKSSAAGGAGDVGVSPPQSPPLQQRRQASQQQSSTASGSPQRRQSPNHPPQSPMRRAGGGDAASGGSVFDVSSLRLDTTGLVGVDDDSTVNGTGAGADTDADTFSSPPGIEMTADPFAKILAHQDGRHRPTQAPLGALRAEVAAVRRRAPSKLPKGSCVVC